MVVNETKMIAGFRLMLLSFFLSLFFLLLAWVVYQHYIAKGFGYANQRIVREIRIDTFFSILKQDIGFFDGQTSGELASRLNSDCGEMAGDLVRITWKRKKRG